MKSFITDGKTTVCVDDILGIERRGDAECYFHLSQNTNATLAASLEDVNRAIRQALRYVGMVMNNRHALLPGAATSGVVDIRKVSDV